MGRPLDVLLACAAALWLSLAGPPAHALSLLEAYHAALRNDPAWRAAQHEHEAGVQALPLGRSHLLPSISANYSPARNNADVTNTAGAAAGTTDHRRYNSLSANIQLRQPLVHPEGMARYRQGVAQAAGSDAQLMVRLQDLVVRVVSAYTFARYSEDQLAQAQAQRDALGAQRASNRRLFERGEGTRTEVAETQARYDLAVAQVLEATDNVTAARDALALIVGEPVRTLDSLPEDYAPRQVQARTFEEWRDVAMATNPELHLQRRLLEAAREDVNRNRAGHLPRLDLVASVGRNDSDTINTFNQQATVRTVGLQLTVPIYAGGATTASVTQAVATQEKVAAELDGKTGQVLNELRKQHNLATSSLTRLDAARAAVDSARLLVEATQRSVSGGQRTNVDVLNAQQQLFDARRDLAQARYNHLLALVRLRYSAGTLQASDLADISAQFKPASTAR
jgi:protease secretion system outer membrane protein